MNDSNVNRVAAALLNEQPVVCDHNTLVAAWAQMEAAVENYNEMHPQAAPESQGAEIEQEKEGPQGT